MNKILLLLLRRIRRGAVGYMLLGAGAALLIPAALPSGGQGAPGAEIVFEKDRTQETDIRQGDRITIPGFEVWNVSADAQEVDAAFYNPAHNPCYFVITVTLDDTGETVYGSNYVKPGQSLSKVRLSRALARGIYPATIHYAAYSLDDFSPLNGADVPLDIAAA